MARHAGALAPERDDQLVWVAAEAFLRGYRQASLNQIIATAGMSKSSFYHYFANKRELHDHTINTLSSHLDAALEVNFEDLTAETFWPSIHEVAQRLGELTAETPRTLLLARILHHPEASPGGDCALERLRADVDARATKLVKRGQLLGTVRRDLPADLIVELVRAWLLTLDRWVRGHAEPAGATIKDALAALVEAVSPADAGA